MRALVHSGRSVLILAPAGFGRSFVASSALAHLPAPAGTRTIVCPPRSSLDRFEQQLKAAPTSAVLLIDDAQYLDPDSLDLLIARIQLGYPTIVTARTDTEHIPDPDAASPTTRLLELWQDRQIERIDLQPLPDKELGDLIARTIDPAQLDSLTLATIIRLSGGSPLLAQELAQDAANVRRAHYAAGRHPLLTPAIVSGRISDLLHPELRCIDDDLAARAIVLHELGVLPRSSATRLLGSRAVEELIRHRVAVTLPGDDLIAVKGLHADVLHSVRSMPALTAARQHTQERLLEDWRRHLRLSEDQLALLAHHLLRTPEALTPEEHRPGAVVLLRSARNAVRRGAFAVAEEVARSALLLDESCGGRVELAQSHLGEGRIAEAHEALDTVVFLSPDDHRAEEHLYTRMITESWGPQLSEGTRTMLDAFIASENPAQRAFGIVLDAWTGRRGFVESTFRELSRIGNDSTVPESTRLWALALLVLIQINGQDADALERAIHAGRALRASLMSNRAETEGAFAEDALSAFLLSATCARIITGVTASGLQHDLDELAQRITDRSQTTSSMDRLAVLFTSGLSAYIRGDLALSDVEMTAAGQQLSPLIHSCMAAYLQVLHAAIRFRIGHSSDRREILSGLPASEQFHPAWRELYERMLNSVVRLVPSSDPLLDVSPHGDLPWLRLTALYFSALYDGTLSRALDALLPRDREITFPRSIAMIAHIDADASGDPNDFVRAAELLAAQRMNMPAARAYEAARAAFVTRRATGRANECAQMAEALTGRRSNGATVTAHVRAPKPSDQLSRREREVCDLVSEGLSNQQIAERLFLSVRTVESHVLQARAKLGAERRTDIAALLRDDLIA